MFVRGITLSVAAFLAIGLFGAAAGAGQSSPPPPPSEDDSLVLPALRHIPGLRILLGDDTAPPDETAARNGKNSDFDESYYEPQPNTPPKKKKTAIAPKPAAADNAAPSAAGVSTGATKAPSSEKTAAGSLPCDKAAAVISGYGFSEVTPASCNGKVYAFNARRDGKSFAIKFDSASGELADVKKLP